MKVLKGCELKNQAEIVRLEDTCPSSDYWMNMAVEFGIFSDCSKEINAMVLFNFAPCLRDYSAQIMA